MKKIAIIGFGFCGKMLFANLVRSEKKYKILIFDEAPQSLSSVAFASFSPHYILNVPASKMNAFTQNDEKNFCQFLKKNHPEILEKITHYGFAPRQIYGQYLQEILDESFTLVKKNNIEVELIKQEVISVEGESEFLITTKNNQKFCADEVALATSFKQSNLPWKIDDKNVVAKLWNQNSLAFHQKKFTDETICLIGSGLTAVDVIVGLKNKNFRGKIFVVSRRGNFPQKHFATQNQDLDFISTADAKKGVLFLCQKVRQFLRANPQFDLRHVVDSVRSKTPEMWNNFDQKNKKLFMRLFGYWNIFRHRAPISSIEIIEEMIASNQLEIKKGGVVNLFKKGEKIIVQGKGEEFETDYLVNCLGFEFNAKKYPLLNQMIESNLLKQSLMMVESQNPKIHLLGGLNIGKDFECTAVPDLRLDVKRVFELL